MASASQPDSSALSSGAVAASPGVATMSPLEPWIQLVSGVICMAMIANLQYGWTVFVGPIDAKHHWGKAAIQGTFTLFILLETWLVPFEAYLAELFEREGYKTKIDQIVQGKCVEHEVDVV